MPISELIRAEIRNEYARLKPKLQTRAIETAIICLSIVGGFLLSLGVMVFGPRLVLESLSWGLLKTNMKMLSRQANALGRQLEPSYLRYLAPLLDSLAKQIAKLSPIEFSPQDLSIVKETLRSTIIHLCNTRSLGKNNISYIEAQVVDRMIAHGFNIAFTACKTTLEDFHTNGFNETTLQKYPKLNRAVTFLHDGKATAGRGITNGAALAQRAVDAGAEMIPAAIHSCRRKMHLA